MWLLKSGKLDFSLIRKSYDQGYFWLICIFLFIIQGIIASYRWNLILSVKSSNKINLVDVLKVSWIGMFFNTMLPGAVTGDLIKLLYAKDLDQSLDRSFLVTSVLIDRILGLIGLLTILGISCLFYYSEITLISNELKHLTHFNLLLFVGGIFFLILMILPHKIQVSCIKIINLIPFVGEKISNIIKSFWLLGSNRITLFKTFFLSVAVQSLNIFAFWIITHPFYANELSFTYLFTFIPTGLIAVAIPISPSGIGVGHLVFDKLFNYINISNGASLFNLYFICAFFVNFLGVIPYLITGKKHHLNETEQFETLT